MERQRLESRSVRSAGYDAASRELELEFATGRVYRYEGVPGSVWDWLLRTKNKGSFVTRMISPTYAYRVVGDERAPRGTAPEDLLDALRRSLSK
jgi:hypothetical protein